ncbi:maleylpyruvate isomerase N-terminal domain-containing protein [Streptomyces sp. NBC_01465]|uniref:maleylpyruvate isomerase N-terminal domain-containing protein n=1 Tax=Streptomyces sp. NBC_01465 TaxID=2903878 RepID=UPI002E307B0D|nr:maleylpyruvate isomerase N-terminal domain-containing protein [Streptomyces sp. NBC_01465]
MSEGHEAVRDLLGAWALRAGEPGDERLVRDHLAGCAPCTAEAARLRTAVAVLDGPDDIRTPAGARGAVLAAALGRREAAPRVAAHAAPYAAAVAGLDALLREVGDSGADGADGADGLWAAPVVHDWDVHATVAHLVAADEPLALRLAPDPGEAPPPSDAPWHETWAARTAAVIAREHARTPAATWRTWREQTRTLLASPSAYSTELACTEVELMGLRLPVAEHFLIRAFETWVHTDDIGRAIGHSVPPPAGEHLRRLVGLALRILQRATNPGAPPVLLTLRGPGPDDIHRQRLGSDTGPVVGELAVDTVDFCLLMGGRYAPGDIPQSVTGDRSATLNTLERAASLAWL